MTTAGDLLPSNALAFEQAVARASTDTLPVPIREIMDPYETPVAFLPFLAAHESVDLWFEDWSGARKREMVAQCAGVSAVRDGKLADLKGTREGLRRYLSFVDAEIVDLIAHPARFVVGRAAIGRMPIAHPPLTAHYLVKVMLQRPPNAFVIGRSAIGRAALRQVDMEPIRRARLAMSIAKAPETLYTAAFAWRRRIQISDGIPIDGSHPVGGWVDRMRL